MSQNKIIGSQGQPEKNTFESLSKLRFYVSPLPIISTSIMLSDGFQAPGGPVIGWGVAGLSWVLFLLVWVFPRIFSVKANNQTKKED
jgi:hypothetical protein